MADDLRCFVEDRPIRARRATAFERIIRWSRRNRAMAVLTATAASALLFAAIVGWVGYASTKQALRRSDENVKLSLAVFGELFDKLLPDESFFPPPTGRRDQRRPRAGAFERGKPPDAKGEPGRPFEAGVDADAEHRQGPPRWPPRGERSDRFGTGSRPVPLAGPGEDPFASHGPTAGETARNPRVVDAEGDSARSCYRFSIFTSNSPIGTRRIRGSKPKPHVLISR